ncbi:hypothetical protein SAY87_001014 [Trapa incisa]|uniref:Uncharacterized protein n=1 Tax=Trapa incisa TaxID=236973 RepID=A0AAN7GN23_9MYRT|nr:hypothetical protein SAY87_001014 [Trapa incisa]
MPLIELSCDLKFSQAPPKLSEDKVKHCVDARQGGEYPPKAVAKFALLRLLRCVYNTKPTFGPT